MVVRRFRQNSKWSIPGARKAMRGGSTRSILVRERGLLLCGDGMTNPRRDWSSIKYMPVSSASQFSPTRSQKGSASTLIGMSVVDVASETAAVSKTSCRATAWIGTRPLVPPCCSETALAGDHCTVRLLNDVASWETRSSSARMASFCALDWNRICSSYCRRSSFWIRSKLTASPCSAFARSSWTGKVVFIHWTTSGFESAGSRNKDESGRTWYIAAAAYEIF